VTHAFDADVGNLLDLECAHNNWFSKKDWKMPW